MKINVRAKPAAREDKIEKIDEENFVVSVKEPPVKGKANLAIVKLLSEYFNVSQDQVRIVAGHFQKQKVIEIGEA